jgi:fructose-1,6-bisphosphatase I
MVQVKEEMLSDHQRLELYLETIIARSPHLRDAGEAVRAMAEAGKRIAKLLACGPLAGDLAAIVGDSIDGDGQKALDVLTHDIVREALRDAPVAVFASEEADQPDILNPTAHLAVAVDPLDGSSNVDTLAPVGTIFSILPITDLDLAAPESAFYQPGRNQLAAGFLIYGPHTALVLTIGAGTAIFTLDPVSQQFLATITNVAVSPKTREYAINGSNMRHWDPEIRSYIVDLKKGHGGPRGVDFNMRWLASMVAEAYRILQRGGIYLYPVDQRPNYRSGRLRLIYEANPIAMIMEQAGAAATDGHAAILDLCPESLHQRCALVFGSADEVTRVREAYLGNDPAPSPLFKSRSLFRQAGSDHELLT